MATLNWKKPKGDSFHELEAVTDFGRYFLDESFTSDGCFLWRPGAGIDDYEEFGSVGEAKERALEDFYERIYARNG